MEGNSEAPGRLEWFHDVAHHVDLSLFVSLGLAPPGGIVEQVEVTRQELTFQVD